MTLPSIRNRALLVSVSFSKPQLTKLDRKATIDAERANNAHGVLRTQKMLYPKDIIDPIVQHEAAVYGYVRRMTTPWGSTGLHLLDTRRFMEFSAQMDKFRIQRQQLVTVFAQDWANVLQRAREQQGDLFDPTVYPDVHEVVDKFDMRVNYMPVGSVVPEIFDSIEAELQDAVREQVTREVEQTTKAMLEEAIRTPLIRLFDAVLNVYDKTSRDNARVHDSLMEELDNVIDMMPSYNVLDLPILNTLAERCKTRLSVHIEALKEKDGPVRARVAEEAKTLLSEVGLDPVVVQASLSAADPKDRLTERKKAAMAAADNIMSKMKGLF